MIAELTFGPAHEGVRRVRFVPRVSIPLQAACLVANGLRETLRELLGERCELVLGEPAAIDPNAWALLAADAFLFLTRGRQTDIVLVLPHADARRLVLRAFGEGDALPEGACTALEVHALERIASRCAVAFDPLCAERLGASRAVAAREVPQCAAYFDVRVHAPVPLTLGIGIVRDLPDPGPSGSLPPAALEGVPVRGRVVLGSGTIAAAAVANLRRGDVVMLDAALEAQARLTLGGRTYACGTCGVAAGRSAFLVGEVPA